MILLEWAEAAVRHNGGTKRCDCVVGISLSLFVWIFQLSLFFVIYLSTMVDTDRQPRRRYFGGVCALIAVVFIWVSSSFAMNVRKETHTIQ